MKRTFLLSFFVFAICFPTFLIADIYDDFTLFRVSLYNKENIEEVSRALTEWENNFIGQNLTEEQKITLKNLFILEKISILKNEKKKIYSLFRFF